MNKLIIISGIGGVGKTTIAKKLYDSIEECTLLSIDEIKEKVFDLVGFIDKEDKRQINKINYNLFEKLLNHVMKRKDKYIIVEYPFDKMWQDTLEFYLKKYEYEAITINVTVKSFNVVWNRINSRNNSEFRHPAHSNKIYNPQNKDEFKSFNEKNYNEFKREYEDNKYSNINLGKVINYVNNEEEDIINLIEKIKKL